LNLFHIDKPDLNSRALQLHVFDLETASPLHRAELTYHCGVTYFPECSLSPSGRWYHATRNTQHNTLHTHTHVLCG
jgi:hypothetical protein